jgi:hypothetical protein
MTKTQIVIFILVVLGNGVMALWKKHKDRQAELAAAKLARSAGGAEEINHRIAARQARRAQAQQPSVITSSAPATLAAPSDAVSFEDVVRVEMRRLAAMRAVLEAAGSNSAAGQSGCREADAPSADAAPGVVVATDSALRGRRLLGTMTLRNAIIAREVLGPPRSARPWTGSIS